MQAPAKDVKKAVISVTKAGIRGLNQVKSEIFQSEAEETGSQGRVKVLNNVNIALSK